MDVNMRMVLLGIVVFALVAVLIDAMMRVKKIGPYQKIKLAVKPKRKKRRKGQAEVEQEEDVCRDVLGPARVIKKSEHLSSQQPAPEQQYAESSDENLDKSAQQEQQNRQESTEEWHHEVTGTVIMPESASVIKTEARRAEYAESDENDERDESDENAGNDAILASLQAPIDLDEIEAKDVPVLLDDYEQDSHRRDVEGGGNHANDVTRKSPFKAKAELVSMDTADETQQQDLFAEMTEIANDERSERQGTAKFATTPEVKPEDMQESKHTLNPQSTRKNRSESGTHQSPINAEDNLMLVVFVAAGEEEINGADLLPLLLDANCKLSSQNIFHCNDESDDNHTSLFSVANAVKPWQFNANTMENDSYQGLCFVMNVDSEDDGKQADFEQMIDLASRIADTCQAKVLDDKHSVFTLQTREHYRQNISEHQRQLRLKRYKDK